MLPWVPRVCCIIYKLFLDYLKSCLHACLFISDPSCCSTCRVWACWNEHFPWKKMLHWKICCSWNYILHSALMVPSQMPNSCTLRHYLNTVNVDFLTVSWLQVRWIILSLVFLLFCRSSFADLSQLFFLMSWWYSRFNIWFSFFVLTLITHHPETLVCHLAPSDYTMSNYRAKWKTPVKPASCAALNLFWLTVTKNITKRAFGQFGERLPDHKQPQLQSHLQTRLNTVLMKSYVFFVTHTSTRMNSNRLKVLESISMTLRPQVQEPHFSLNYQISLGFV